MPDRLKIPEYIGVNAAGEKIVLADDCITQGFAWLAKRRRGKSYGAGVELEIFAQRRYPFVVLDPAAAHVGLRYRMAEDGRSPEGASGLNVLILGGDHADVLFDPHGGKIFAQVVVEHNISAVVDLKRVSWADRKRFVADFANELFLINKTPRHVVLEEAQNFIPQQLRFEEQKAVFIAVETLIKEGGGQGIGFTIISQRAAAIAKDCLNMIDNLILLGMAGTTDIKAVREWCQNNAPELTGSITADLPMLAPGEAWIVAPEWLPSKAERIKIRTRVTWHAGRTPRHGDRQPKPVKDIAEVAHQFKALLEERKADWAADQQSRKDLETKLRQRDREIEQLKKELEHKGKAHVTVPAKADPKELGNLVDQAVQRTLAPIAEQIKARDKATDSLFKNLLRSTEQFDRFTAVFNQTVQAAGAELGGFVSLSLGGLRKEVLEQVKNLRTVHRQEPAPRPLGPASQLAPVIPIAGGPIADAGEIKLRDGAVRMLAAAAQFYPEWVPKQRIASLASLRIGGTFSTYQSDLSRFALVEIRGGAKGVELRATQAGLDYLGSRGDVRQAPATTEEVLRIWEPKLRKGALRMLKVIIGRNGETISKAELSQESGIEIGGTFSTYLSDLRTAGLVSDGHGGIAANRETLFL